MTTSNPFTARIAKAAQEGYIGTPRTRRPRTGAGSRLTALEADQTLNAPLEPMATDRQVAFMLDLILGRDFSGETRPAWAARVQHLQANWDTALRDLTQVQASAFIEYAMGMPELARTPEAETNAATPAGHYALPSRQLSWNLSNEIVFFQVDRPERGKWAGYTFITMQTGGEYVRLNRRQQDEVKDTLRVYGFQEASQLYGRELGRCGVCARELTNDASREAGIGPKCQAKMGW